MGLKPQRETPLVITSLISGLGAYYCICEKKLYKAFCGSRGSCVKSDNCPQLSLDSASVGSEDYEFESEKKNLGIWR